MWPPSSGRNGNRLMIASDSEITANRQVGSPASLETALWVVSETPTMPLICLRFWALKMYAGSFTVSRVMNQKLSAVVLNAFPNEYASRGPLSSYAKPTRVRPATLSYFGTSGHVTRLRACGGRAAAARAGGGAVSPAPPPPGFAAPFVRGDQLRRVGRRRLLP